MKIEDVKIGEVFKEDGKIYKCCDRKHNDCFLICEECCFKYNPKCLRYKCTSIDRKDAKSVYFIKATPAELEEYEQVEQARNRG